MSFSDPAAVSDKYLKSVVDRCSEHAGSYILCMLAGDDHGGLCAFLLHAGKIYTKIKK